jgi:hypothetical protein
VLRWLPRVLVGLSLFLAVVAVVEQRWVAGVLWALATAYWTWRARSRPTVPPPPPAHADEDWARGVLAAAGAPEGVRAVKALREAEPGLSLLHAEQLADRLGVR